VPPSANPGNTGAQPGFQEGSTTPLPPTGPTGAATGGGNAPASLGSETAPQGNAPTTVASDLGAWIVSQLSDGSGVKLTSADLATTIIQRFGNGHGFTTDITNSANDRTFTNTTDMNLFLNNFAQVSAQALTSQLLTNLTVDMAHQSALGN
jgi:hypothetical protein